MTEYIQFMARIILPVVVLAKSPAPNQPPPPPTHQSEQYSVYFRLSCTGGHYSFQFWLNADFRKSFAVGKLLQCHNVLLPQLAEDCVFVSEDHLSSLSQPPPYCFSLAAISPDHLPLLGGVSTAYGYKRHNHRCTCAFCKSPKYSMHFNLCREQQLLSMTAAWRINKMAISRFLTIFFACLQVSMPGVS